MVNCSVTHAISASAIRATTRAIPAAARALVIPAVREIHAVCLAKSPAVRKCAPSRGAASPPWDHAAIRAILAATRCRARRAVTRAVRAAARP